MVSVYFLGSLLPNNVAGLLAASIERDWADWTTWGTNLLLALIGIGGIVVAVKTLLKIKRQTMATEAAAVAAGDAVKIAQATLVSTFRPKLIVRNLSICPDARQATNEKRWMVGYDLVNVGGTVAQVVHSEVCVHYNKGRLGGKYVGDASDTLDSKDEFSLQSGEYKEIFMALGSELTDRLGLLETRSTQWITNPVLVGAIYLTGRIEYRDDIGNSRRTAFHRSYDPATTRFSVVADPDWEYSD